jgi:FkbM family methyltransferase
LVINRPKCININCAVSDKNGKSEFIVNTGYTEMLSGLKETYDERHFNRLRNENARYNGKSDVILINTKMLKSIFVENNITHVNYLSIDVEGAEFNVIKSIDFDSVFIDVIGFENNYDNTSEPIINYLMSKNYIIIKKSLDIFMIHKDSQFFKNVISN